MISILQFWKKGVSYEKTELVQAFRKKRPALAYSLRSRGSHASLSLYSVHIEHKRPPPVDISTLYADLYAEPDLSETVWPEEKEPFAAAGIRYREREAAFMRFPGGPVDLCCLGDSITQQFEWQDAFPGLRAANRGIGSDTTSGILARLDSVAATEPKVLSLMAGANDMGEEGWTPEGIASNFRMILEELHTRLPETKFLVNSMLPTSAAHPNRPEDMLAVNAELEALCEELDIVYLDMFQAFADENGDLKPVYSLDGIHLTSAGYALWLSYLAPAVAAALE